jgi:colanic acid/amylovoran biosynthesis glycosyltransferase
MGGESSSAIRGSLLQEGRCDNARPLPGRNQSQMKVAFIHHAFPRVHNTFTVNEIVELLRRGVDVSIFSLGRSPDVLRNDNIYSCGIATRTYYCEDFPTDDLSVPHTCEPYMHRFRAPAPSRLRSLLNGKWPARPTIRFSFAAVANRLIDDRYDIIHGAFGNTPATAALVLSEMTGIPWTFETHAYDLFVDFPFAASKFTKASIVFTESNYHRAFLEDKLKAPPGKVEVMHLSPDRLMLDEIEPLPRRDNLVVSVCRLHPIKGLNHALRAIAQIRDEFPTVEYVIVGEGPLDSDLRREAVRLGIHERVRFAGSMTNGEACTLVRQAAVFLLPSVIWQDGDRDGTPTAIAEAMQLEVPVISSNISGIPELVEDGVTGILTPPGSVDDIALALRRLLNDRALRIAMGRAGRQKVLAEFDVERNAEKLLTSWEAVLRRPSHSEHRSSKRGAPVG